MNLFTIVEKFDPQSIPCSAPITMFEPAAIEPQKLWLRCVNQNEQYIACGAYLSCETGGKTTRFWLGLIFSETEPQTGLYARIPASEVKDHSESKTVCGMNYPAASGGVSDFSTKNLSFDRKFFVLRGLLPCFLSVAKM